MLFRLLLLILFLPVLLQAQVERDAPANDPSLEVIGSWPGPWNLANDSDSLTLSEPQEVQDYALTFNLTFEKAPSGDHLVDFMALEADGALTVNVSLSPSGHLMCRKDSDMSWMSGLLPLGRKVSIAINVKRDARQALSGLWIDGIEQASALMPPGKIKLVGNVLHVGTSAVDAMISEVKMFRRALSRSEILHQYVSSGGEQRSLAPMAGRFELHQNEVIALLGGSEAVAIAEEGTLESLLMLSYAAQKPKLRSLAWETDTVFRQDRPLNFGDLSLQLRRCEATCVFLMFGRQECLERGESGLEEFRAALDKMMETCKATTPRLVIIEAAPFEKNPPPLPDLSAKNAALAKYNEVLRALAEKHGAFFASSGEGWNHQRSYRLTSDGVNLTREGAQELGLRVLTSARLMDRPDVTALRPLIQAKNKLWHEYWRPSNWAFLYGDRTAQPSSRDHLNAQVRWFPKELEKYQGMIREKEEAIWKQAEELGRKVP